MGSGPGLKRVAQIWNPQRLAPELSFEALVELAHFYQWPGCSFTAAGDLPGRIVVIAPLRRVDCWKREK
jgi:hypothetical protein